MKPFKHCPCCLSPLKTSEVHWLAKVMISKTSILKLFNCPHCHSTGAVKVLKKGK